MSKLSVIFILSIVFVKSILPSRNSELLSVIVIYRHGSRAPRGTYKNDPYRGTTSHWGAEYGHLTNEGITQLYKLGQWLRERYNGFLSNKYLENEFRVISSDKDRCLMSAAACLAGLYPPEGDQIWNKDLLWRPVPIRVIPDNDDALLKQTKRCVRHERLYNEEMKKEYFQNIAKENQELFKHVSKKSGENITTLRELKYLFNVILTQSYFNVALPRWAKDAFEKMECLATIQATSYTCTTELARLKTGPLINTIITYFEQIINKEDVQKFLMYSAHYTTLMNVRNTMRIYDFEWPEYGSIIIFELRRDQQQYVVNMLFRNSTGITKLSLLDCPFDCRFSDFKQSLAPVTINQRDWQWECFGLF